eukprot:6033027-Pyramimonas_sp.AAC.1
MPNIPRPGRPDFTKIKYIYPKKDKPPSETKAQCLGLQLSAPTAVLAGNDLAALRSSEMPMGGRRGPKPRSLSRSCCTSSREAGEDPPSRMPSQKSR